MVNKVINKINGLSVKITNLYSPKKSYTCMENEYIKLYKEKKEILKLTMWNPKEKNIDVKYINRINEINNNLRILKF